MKKVILVSSMIELYRLEEKTSIIKIYVWTRYELVVKSSYRF